MHAGHHTGSCVMCRRNVLLHHGCGCCQRWWVALMDGPPLCGLYGSIRTRGRVVRVLRPLLVRCVSVWVSRVIARCALRALLQLLSCWECPVRVLACCS